MNILTTARIARIVFRARKLIALAVLLEAIIRRSHKSSKKQSKSQPVTDQAHDIMTKIAAQMADYGNSLKKHYNQKSL